MTLREEILKQSGVLEEGVLKDMATITKRVYQIFDKDQAKDICQKISNYVDIATFDNVDRAYHHNYRKDDTPKSVYHELASFFNKFSDKDILDVFNKHTNKYGFINYDSLRREIRHLLFLD